MTNEVKMEKNSSLDKAIKEQEIAIKEQEIAQEQSKIMEQRKKENDEFHLAQKHTHTKQNK